MTQWSAFVGFTGVVLTGFLALARLSQRVVDDPGGPRVPDADGDLGEPRPTEPEPNDKHSVDGTSPTIAGPAAPYGDLDGSVDGTDGTVEATDVTESPDSDVTESPGPDATMSPGALLANVALTQGLFGGLVAAAAWYFEIPGSALGLRGGAVEGQTAVAVGVGFGVVLWVGNELATAVADEVGATYDEGLRRLLAPDDATGWVLLLGATLPVIALVEEFLFRAAVVGATSAAYGGAWALAVVSSIAFALGHGAQGRVGIVVTGALGFALAAGFVLTGSFLVVVVAHYLVNALEFAVHEGVGLPDPVWSSR